MLGRPAGTLFSNTILRQSLLHFNPREFDAEIISHGTRGDLKHGQICPCLRIETNQARANCPSCRGVGWLYPDDMVCKTWMMTANRAGRSMPHSAGEVTTGQAEMMAMSGITIGRGDMWKPCGEVHVVHQAIRRAQQQVDTNALRARIQLQSHTDQVRIPVPRVERLLYPEVTRIDALYFENADGAAQRAREGSDYRLVGNEIRWLADAGPPPGKAYSCRYRAPAAYLIDEVTPAWGEEGGQKMPWLVKMSRLDRLQDADLQQKQTV